jgi:hypothetical protein
MFYPYPKTKVIAIALPTEAPPNAVKAAEAVVCPVPPLVMGRVPVTLAVKEQ